METMKHITETKSLVEMKKYEKAKIMHIRTEDATKLRKLMAFGIMPGLEISVLQKYPSVVIQVGFTQVALDDDIASEILVQL